MTERTAEHLNTKPHYRQVKYQRSDWQQIKFLSDLKTSLLGDESEAGTGRGGMSAGRWDWWPTLPAIKEEEQQHALYIALLVLYIKCGEELTPMLQHERKLHTFEATIRGQVQNQEYKISSTLLCVHLHLSLYSLLVLLCVHHEAQCCNNAVTMLYPADQTFPLPLHVPSRSFFLSFFSDVFSPLFFLVVPLACCVRRSKRLRGTRETWSSSCPKESKRSPLRPSPSPKRTPQHYSSRR